MQPSHVQSVEIEKEIFTHQEDSVWFAVSMCDSRGELKRRKAIFEKLPSVAKTEEIASLIPEPDRQRQQAVAEIHQSLVRLLDDAPPPENGSVSQAAVLGQELARGVELLSADLPYESAAAQGLSASGAAAEPDSAAAG